jgi:hypothetical protein
VRFEEENVFVVQTDGRHRYHIVEENPDLQKRKRGSASTTDPVSKTTRGGTCSQTQSSLVLNASKNFNLEKLGKTAFDLVGGPFRRQALSLELSPEPDLNDGNVCEEAQFELELDERKERAGRRQTEVIDLRFAHRLHVHVSNAT